MDLQIGDQVHLVIETETDLGFIVLINEEYEGLLYRNEIFSVIAEGMDMRGFIKNIREDGKIDVSLRPQGFRNVIDLDVEKVLTKLKKSKEGFLLLTDKSSPESIKFHLNMSKKAFKKAIGNLYKKQLIVLKDDRIELI